MLYIICDRIFYSHFYCSLKSVVGSGRMTSASNPKTSDNSLLSLFKRELYILWKFTYYDLSTSVIPSTIFAIVSWFSSNKTLSNNPVGLIQAVLFAIAYFWSYIASFNISNQINSMEEDAINKPDRPIPSGLSTIRGAWIRLAISYTVFLFLGIVGGFWICSVVWIIVCIVHNHLLLARNWLIKSWSMTAGTIAMLTAGWLIGGTFSLPAYLWLCTIAILLFPTCPIQDLRDQEGDIKLNRQTLPIRYGDNAARKFLAAVFILNPFVTLFVSLMGEWIKPVSLQILITFNAIIFLISWTIAFRIWRYRTKEADHRSYMLYTYWFVFCLAFSIFIL